MKVKTIIQVLMFVVINAVYGDSSSVNNTYSSNLLFGPDNLNTKLTYKNGLLLPLLAEIGPGLGIGIYCMADYYKESKEVALWIPIVCTAAFGIPGSATITQKTNNKAGWILMGIGCIGLVDMVYFANKMGDDNLQPSYQRGFQIGLGLYTVTRILDFVRTYKNYKEWKVK